jgi:hypothetical protein
MPKSLEARVAKLEAEQGSANYGPVRGRQLAELAGYTGEKLEEMAKFFAGQPHRSHEEWVEALSKG